VAEVRGEWAFPLLRSTGQPICSGSFSFHREQPLVPRLATTEPERSRTVGANATAHPPLAASGPYLPSLSLAPSARHYLRQEPYAGNPPVRIRAGGTAKAVSLPRPHFFRCEAPRLSQLAILPRQRIPQTDHFGRLPAAAKQTLDRLPIIMVKQEADTIVPRAKIDADLFFFVEPRRREEIAAFPEDQCVAEIKPFQDRPKFRNSRVIEERILQSKSSGKIQPDRKLRLRSPMKFETVFAFLKRWQWPRISQPRIGTPKRAILQGLSVAEIVATGAYAPENRPVRSQRFIQLFDIQKLFVVENHVEKSSRMNRSRSLAVSVL